MGPSSVSNQTNNGSLIKPRGPNVFLNSGLFG